MLWKIMAEGLPNRNGRDSAQQKWYQYATWNEQKAEIIIDTRVGQIESINIKEMVKQGSIFRPIMCCTNNIKSKQHMGDSTVLLWKKLILECQFIWMTSGGIAEIRKGIKNDAKMEKEKKMR